MTFCHCRCDGEAPSLFRSFDIEMATEGEYWMVLKGFLLLHRDASTGRFSAQRAGGFGSYHRHADVVDNRGTKPIAGSFSEVLPPTETHRLISRIIHKVIGVGEDSDPADKIVPYDGVAPPSDYFLGFSSPGTQVCALHCFLYPSWQLNHLSSSYFINRSGVGSGKQVLIPSECMPWIRGRS